jgi:hypothetical protein
LTRYFYWLERSSPTLRPALVSIDAAQFRADLDAVVDPKIDA